MKDLQPVGYGLMNFTWVASRKFNSEQFNKILKDVIDFSKASAQHPLFINGGEFYGIPNRYEGLELLKNFFIEFPDYSDRVFLSIKGLTTKEWAPDTSTSNIHLTTNIIDDYLTYHYQNRKTLPKCLDMFTIARVGQEPITEVIKQVSNKPLIGSVCISEVTRSTLDSVLKSVKVSAIEIEFSLFHCEAIDNGLLELCAENNILVVCYSPLGKGILVGQTSEDLAKDDLRFHFDKFNDPVVVKHNAWLVQKIHNISKKLDITMAQVAISWITTLSGSSRKGKKFPRLLPIPGSTDSVRQINNLSVVHLSEETMNEIDEILSGFKTAGHRYNKVLDKLQK